MYAMYLIQATLIADDAQGGPGCSSFDGLMMEVGPWRMDGKGGFRVKEGGWEEYTTMVYSASRSFHTLGLTSHLSFSQLTNPPGRVSPIPVQTISYNPPTRCVAIMGQ